MICREKRLSERGLAVRMRPAYKVSKIESGVR